VALLGGIKLEMKRRRGNQIVSNLMVLDVSVVVPVRQASGTK
jgi:hypothetical protein